MPTTWRTVAFVGLLTALFAGASGHAQEPARPQEPQVPADQQTPVFRAGINFVRVDVIATDKAGNPVLDLNRDDFAITEDGKPQTIETFKFVELDGGLSRSPDDAPRVIRNDADLEVEAAREDVRLFGIFLDDYHVRRESSLRAREELARFVETQLGPSDLVGTMYPLEPAASVQFTRDHGLITGGLRRFWGRKYDYTPRNQFEENASRYPTETVERIRNEVSLSALHALISRLGALKEGRKALILVSEGYTYLVPPQLRSRVAGVPDPRNPAQGDPMAGVGSLMEERAASSADLAMQVDLRRVYAAANRNNVAIYTVDPRGLAAGEFGLDQNIGGETDRSFLNATMDTLRMLASETDGRAIVNRNNLTLAMKQIVRDSSAYYLLGYNSTTGASDGKFHEIKVRISRPGVQVRARNGYWALEAQEAERALAPPKPGPPAAVSAALAVINRPERRRFVRTWIGAERGENGNTKMTFLWEPLPPTPGLPASAVERPASVSLTAAGSSGTSYFRGRVPSTAARVTFDAQPGTLQLRMSVEDARADVIDTETQSMTVPDLTSPQAALGTPALFRARTVRELQQLKADVTAVPTAAREFSRTERLLVRVTAYGPGGSLPTVKARLLNSAGEPMADLAVVSERDLPSSIEVPLVGLAVGEYLVEISAAGDAGTVSELVGFRVTT